MKKIKLDTKVIFHCSKEMKELAMEYFNSKGSDLSNELREFVYMIANKQKLLNKENADDNKQ